MEDRQAVKLDFNKKVAVLIAQYHIPRKFLLNADETGIPFLLSPDHTRAVEGSKEILGACFGDKRQVTGVPLVSATGDFLGLQVIFQGKTQRSLPPNHEQFPNKIHCTFSETHWVTVAAQKELLTRFVLPYVRQHAEGLITDQHFLLVYDLFKTHFCLEFINWFRTTFNGSAGYPHGHLAFVPANMTADLQPLDITVQGQIKCLVRKQTGVFLFEAIKKAKFDGRQLGKTFPAEQLKPRLVEGMNSVVDWFCTDSGRKLIMKGWESSGLLNSFDGTFQAAAEQERERLFPQKKSKTPDVVNPAKEGESGGGEEEEEEEDEEEEKASTKTRPKDPAKKKEKPEPRLISNRGDLSLESLFHLFPELKTA